MPTSEGVVERLLLQERVGLFNLPPDHQYVGFGEAATTIAEQAGEIERLRGALTEIEQWGRAYPLAAFPEPDFGAARTLLEAGGLTLDAVSASNMRHVLTEVAERAEGEPAAPQAGASPSEAFGAALSALPALALAAGCFVGIKVTELKK